MPVRILVDVQTKDLGQRLRRIGATLGSWALKALVAFLVFVILRLFGWPR
jgi:hypothetical protein